MAFADHRRALTDRGGRDGPGWACVRRGAMAMAGRELGGRAVVGLKLDGPAGRVRLVRARVMVAPEPGGPMADSRVRADRAAVALKSGSPAGGPGTGGLEQDVPAADGLMSGSRAVDVPAMAGLVAVALVMVGPAAPIRELVSRRADSLAPGVPAVGDRVRPAPAADGRATGVPATGGQVAAGVRP